MNEDKEALLQGVGIQTVVRMKQKRPNQKEDVLISGNRVTLVDINSRVREEAEVNDAVLPHMTNDKIYERNIRAFIPVALQGINVGVTCFGSSGSGKSHTLHGTRVEPGLIQMFVTEIMDALQAKEEASLGNGKYSYSLKLQFGEVLGEEIRDLLGSGSVPMKARFDEWESVVMEGVEKHELKSLDDFVRLYALGLKNRVNIMTGIGHLSDRASTLLILEITQFVQNHTDLQVFVSKGTFVEMPGAELLAEDSDSWKAQEGSVYKHGILTLQGLVNDLSAGKLETQIAERSELGKVTRDLFGGNSVSIIIFNLQYDDQIGSGVSMQFLVKCQQIVCYPIQNDNRALGLLRQFRRETLSLRTLLSGSGGEIISYYQKKIEELERELVHHNMDAIRFSDEKKHISTRVNELREKHNHSISQKSEVEKMLLKSEEERLLYLYDK